MKFIKHIGILSAMPEEIGSTLDNLMDVKKFTFGDLNIYQGYWVDHINKKNILLTTAWSGWGKVSAARAATRLLGLKGDYIPIETLIFTGVAGALNNDLNQWDIIVPNKVCQYDMDARPIFDKFIIPSLNKKYLDTDSLLQKWAFDSIKKYLDDNNSSKFGKIYDGIIGTADKFISNEKSRNSIIKEFPRMQAVEMEGAAVAQVAYQEEIPWILIRVISDCADKTAVQNFNDFLDDYSKFSWNLIEVILKNISSIKFKN